MKQFLLPFNPEDSNSRINLGGRDFHYLCRVRRYAKGSSFPAISPDGRRFKLEITAVSSNECSCILHPEETDASASDPEETTKVFLFAALTKGRKMDLTVRQAVEAGAAGLFPMFSEHSQVRPSDGDGMASRMKRWERIAGEALQQCGGSTPIHISQPAGITEALEFWNKRGPLLFLHEKQAEKNIPSGFHSHLALPVGNLGIMVGPEGGFSRKETALLMDNGAMPVYMGMRVLRAETAAIYGLAAALTIIRERNEWQKV